MGAFVPSLHYLVMFILDIVFNKLFDDDDDDRLFVMTKDDMFVFL